MRILRYKGAKRAIETMFSIGRSDLHRLSPRVFFASMAVAVLFTTVLLTRPFAPADPDKRHISVPPVIIQLQDIPETRQVIRTPAPAKPFIPSAVPIPTNDILPDTVTIQQTELDLESVPAAPPAILVPDMGNTGIPSAAAEENEIFEFYNVEEQPKRLNAIVPEYPEMAKRAGIQGAVYLKVLVNAKGAVDSVIVQKGPSVFHNSASDAARRTRFTPARQNDRAVPCWVLMPFRFVLNRNE